MVVDHSPVAQGLIGHREFKFKPVCIWNLYAPSVPFIPLNTAGKRSSIRRDPAVK